MLSAIERWNMDGSCGTYANQRAQRRLRTCIDAAAPHQNRARLDVRKPQ
jgi:hypothetical protein